MRGRQHEHYRRLLLRPLAPQNVTAMGDRLVRVVHEHIGTWPKHATVDLFALANKLMQTVAIALLFGDDREHGFPIAAGLDRNMRSMVWAGLCPVNVPGTPYHRRLKNGVKRLNARSSNGRAASEAFRVRLTCWRFSPPIPMKTASRRATRPLPDTSRRCSGPPTRLARAR